MKPELVAVLQQFQVAELTDQQIYTYMASKTTGQNRGLLEKMASDEARHVEIWNKYTGLPAAPNRWKAAWFKVLFRIFGLTFVINMLKNGEELAVEKYKPLLEDVPETLSIIADEHRHEQELAAMIDEERLKYIGSMVLGLSDALVELTGALAGFTLALGSNSTAGLAGFITGVAATLSMAASEYLSKKADPAEKHPLKAAIYTGVAYLITVALLLLPYALTSSPYAALALCLFNATCIILVFTFFVSVVRREKMWPKFTEMVAISFGVAAISFLIGLGARIWLGLEL